MYDIHAIAGVLIKDYVSKLFLSVKSIVRYTATTKAQMDCSFHKEKCNSSWIMGETTRWVISRKVARVYNKPNRWPSHRNAFILLRSNSWFPLYNCWQKSLFFIELVYFNVSILTYCSFKNFKRGTVSEYRLDCCDLIWFPTRPCKKIRLDINWL